MGIYLEPLGGGYIVLGLFPSNGICEVVPQSGCLAPSTKCFPGMLLPAELSVGSVERWHYTDYLDVGCHLYFLYYFSFSLENMKLE